jgi:hypothetical protein
MLLLGMALESGGAVGPTCEPSDVAGSSQSTVQESGSEATYLEQAPFAA